MVKKVIGRVKKKITTGCGLRFGTSKFLLSLIVSSAFLNCQAQEIKRNYSANDEQVRDSLSHGWSYYYNMALEQLQKRDTTLSISTIDKADSAAKNEFYAKDSLEYWRHRNPIASFFIDVGDYKKAKTILNKCISVFKDADSIKTSMYPVLLMNIGKAYSRTGDFSIAIKYYREALNLRKDMFGWKDARTIKSANDIISINNHSGQTVNSDTVYLEMLNGIKFELGEFNKTHLDISDDYANYLIEMGKRKDALKWLQQTLHRRQILYADTPFHLIPSFHFLGKCYWALNELDSAEFYFDCAHKLAKKYKVSDWLSVIEIGLAEIYRLKGNNKLALRMLSPYYEATKDKGILWIAVNMGSIYHDKGKYKKSLKYFLEFEKFTDKHLNYYMSEKRDELVILYDHISKVYRLLGKHDLAYTYSYLACNTIFLQLNGNSHKFSESDHFSYINKYMDRISWFNCLASLKTHRFYSSGKVVSDGGIFRINELFHLPKKVSYENAFFKKLLFNNDSLITYIDTLNSKLNAKAAAYIRIVRFPLYSESQGYGYLAIIINGNYNHVFLERIDITSSIDSIFSKFKSQIILQKQTDASGHDIFWSKIVPHLEGKRNVYISFDGIFNKLNIETILINDLPNSFIGDNYSVHVVNSSRELFDSNSKQNTLRSISFFGYPNYTLTQDEQASISKSIRVDTTLLANYRGGEGLTGNYVFTPLPATEHEVEEIGADLKQKGWDVQIYTGNRALEEQVKAVRSPRILHIATHGFFAEDIKPEMQSTFMGMDSKAALENPMLRSGLAFAGAERTRTDTTGVRLSGVEDGILTAEEVQYLNLDSTELVVLSACETGLGEIVNGEGVYGLQRAFRAAGAKSVLMSLWKVDDLATETLMKNFYKHWLDEGMTKHDALWQAKLDLRNDKVHPEWAKPFYWGAFVLVGE